MLLRFFASRAPRAVAARLAAYVLLAAAAGGLGSAALPEAEAIEPPAGPVTRAAIAACLRQLDVPSEALPGNRLRARFSDVTVTYAIHPDPATAAAAADPERGRLAGERTPGRPFINNVSWTSTGPVALTHHSAVSWCFYPPEAFEGEPPA